MPIDDEASLLSVVQQIRLDLLAVDVYRCLSDRNVPHALIKGVTTARWLYDPPRAYRDVDILVPGSRISDAIAALAEIASASTGEFGEEASHSQVLLTPAGAEIDVHGALPTGHVDPRDPDRTWRVLGPHTVPFVIDDRTITALDVPGRCLVLAMHVLASGHDSEQVREDLRLALQAADQEEWRQAQELATELGLHEHVGAAIAFVGEGANANDLPLRLTGATASAIQLDRLLHGGFRAAIRLIREELYPSTAFMARYDPSSIGSRRAMAWARLRRLRMILLSLPRAVAELRRVVLRSRSR